MRDCPKCQTMRAQMDEMRDQLAAWEAFDGGAVDTRSLDASRFLGLRSHQAATILNTLLDRPGATVSQDLLIDATKTDGECPRQVLRVLVSRIRRSLESRGLPTVKNKWGHGYMIERDDAARIREAMSRSCSQ